MQSVLQQFSDPAFAVFRLAKCLPTVFRLTNCLSTVFRHVNLFSTIFLSETNVQGKSVLLSFYILSATQLFSCVQLLFSKAALICFLALAIILTAQYTLTYMALRNLIAGGQQSISENQLLSILCLLHFFFSATAKGLCRLANHPRILPEFSHLIVLASRRSHCLSYILI